MEADVCAAGPPLGAFLLICDFILTAAGEPPGIPASLQDTPSTVAKSTEVSPTFGPARHQGGGQMAR